MQHHLMLRTGSTTETYTPPETELRERRHRIMVRRGNKTTVPSQRSRSRSPARQDGTPMRPSTTGDERDRRPDSKSSSKEQRGRPIERERTVEQTGKVKPTSVGNVKPSSSSGEHGPSPTNRSKECPKSASNKDVSGSRPPPAVVSSTSETSKSVSNGGKSQRRHTDGRVSPSGPMRSKIGERRDVQKVANKTVGDRHGENTSTTVGDVTRMNKDDQVMKVFTETVCLRQLFGSVSTSPASSPRSVGSAPDMNIDELFTDRNERSGKATTTVENPLSRHALETIARWFEGDEGRQWLTSKFSCGPCVSCPLQAEICVSCVIRLLKNRLCR
jgi:hypothetical protein